MLGKLLKPLTTAAPLGVATRDLVTGIGAILAMLGILGFLTDEQVAELTKQAPALLTALGTLIYVSMSIYRALFKSSSDKAAEVAKEVDAKIDPNSPVVIKTPAGVPDITVPADRSGK
jgi:hypothetical protein